MKALVVLLALSFNVHADWVIPNTGIVQFQTPTQVVLPTFNVPEPVTVNAPLPSWSEQPQMEPMSDLNLGSGWGE